MADGSTQQELPNEEAALQSESHEREKTDKVLTVVCRELARKEAALKAARGELSQYAFISSHFVKAPLRAIRNYCDFLAEDLEDMLNKEQRQCLDGLERAVRQGEELMDDLIDFSRVGVWEPAIKPVRVGELLEELIAAMTVPPNTQLVVQDQWPPVNGETFLLTQIFDELINNAIKFNHSKHKFIEIGWAVAEEDASDLFVRDNGIGIEPRHQEQVFNMFQKLHSRLDYPGTGIGLAKVRKAAFRLHGTVRVESKPGEGSAFIVTLPNA